MQLKSSMLPCSDQHRHRAGQRNASAEHTHGELLLHLRI